MQSASIFLLDVTNSSKFTDPDALTYYLSQTVRWIKKCTKGIVDVKVIHRVGDEILLVGENYATAYIIATYIYRFWRYEGHKPYFGLTFGDIDTRVSDISSIDQWNHPMVKVARNCLEDIKTSNKRVWMRIDAKKADRQFLRMLNASLETFELLRSQQTANQKAACDLYFLYQRQKDVAKVLDKTPATISVQLRDGHCDQVLKASFLVESSLYYLQEFGYSEEETLYLDPVSLDLHDSLRKFIRKDWRNRDFI